jgi:hypothetical protein
MARIDCPFLGISQKFDFFRDPRAFSNYWILFFTLVEEKITPFPISIMDRFEPFLLSILSSLSLHSLPFFPRSIETIANKIGLSPDVISYVSQKLFKKRLRPIQCQHEAFLEQKLLPTDGLAMLLVTGVSSLPCERPNRVREFSFEFEICDDSLRSLARLYAASILTDQGYIKNTRSNFEFFKKQFQKWIGHYSTIWNFFESTGRNPSFLSLTENETANLIEEMRFPSVFSERRGIIREDSVINRDEEEDYERQSGEKRMERSQSACFMSESSRLIPSLLSEPQNLSGVSKISELDLNDAFTRRMPKAGSGVIPKPQREFSRHCSQQHSMDDGPSFAMAYQIDEPLSESEVQQRPTGIEWDELLDVRQSEFLDLFRISKRLVDCPVAVSVAMEFLKVALRNGQNSDLQVRQLAHLLKSDISSAIWYLSGCEIYQSSGAISIPGNSWDLFLPEIPHPIAIPFCESPDSTKSIEWNHEIVSPPLISIRKPSFNKLSRMRENFTFVQRRLNLPRFEIPLPHHSIDLCDAHETDPLCQFAFGRYEQEFPCFQCFTFTFLMNQINANGVNGIALSSVLKSLGIIPKSPKAADICRILNDLCTADLISRVPSNRIDVSFSRFVPLNRLAKMSGGKVWLVNLHLWMGWDGCIDAGIKTDIRRNIATFVFAHEFCDFEELMVKFCYVSPLDLCFILDSLEADEIIFCQYFERYEGNLTESEVWIPVEGFESAELFLCALEENRRNDYVTIHRIIRTTCEMFTNLCLIDNN